MRRAVEGVAGAAGGARQAKPQGGALRPDPDPAAGQPQGRRGRRGAGSEGRRRVPAQPRALTHSGDLQAVSLALDSTPDVFVMQVLLEDTGEMFTVTNCRSDMTVRELKEELDLIVGIPLNLHRLQYLDQGVLMDDTTLKFHDVIPGGIISLCVWRYDGWTDLVLAAVEGDTSKLSCLGVTEDSLYLTANLHYLGKKQWKKWVHQRAFVALYIASHRGHADVVQYLLEHGADCFGRSPMGRTPLHVATAMGQSDCISLLLLHGASIHAKDAKGMTPKTIAHQLNRRQDEQRMFQSCWTTKSQRA